MPAQPPAPAPGDPAVVVAAAVDEGSGGERRRAALWVGGCECGGDEGCAGESFHFQACVRGCVRAHHTNEPSTYTTYQPPLYNPNKTLRLTHLAGPPLPPALPAPPHPPRPRCCCPMSSKRTSRRRHHRRHCRCHTNRRAMRAGRWPWPWLMDGQGPPCVNRRQPMAQGGRNTPVFHVMSCVMHWYDKGPTTTQNQNKHNAAP